MKPVLTSTGTWLPAQDSNLEPPDPESGALPIAPAGSARDAESTPRHSNSRPPPHKPLLFPPLSVRRRGDGGEVVLSPRFASARRAPLPHRARGNGKVPNPVFPPLSLGRGSQGERTIPLSVRRKGDGSLPFEADVWRRRVWPRVPRGCKPRAHRVRSVNRAPTADSNSLPRPIDGAHSVSPALPGRGTLDSLFPCFLAVGSPPVPL